MARGLTKKEMKKDEFIEAATDAGEWLEDNWKTVIAWAAGLAALALLVSAWHFMSEARNRKAQEFLGQGMQATAEQDYPRAIDLFSQAADKAGSGPAGDVADLYRGIALSRSGRDDEAVPVLEEVAGGAAAPLVQQTARAALAGIHESREEYDRAEAIWLDLAAEPAGLYPAAQALLNAGMDRIAMGREQEARELFEGIVRDHPQTPAAMQAQRLLER